MVFLLSCHGEVGGWGVSGGGGGSDSGGSGGWVGWSGTGNEIFRVVFS